MMGSTQMPRDPVRTISIDMCPRCKYTHREFQVYRFTNPPDVIQPEDPYETKARHYGICPQTGAPLLLFLDRQDDQSDG